MTLFFLGNEGLFKTGRRSVMSLAARLEPLLLGPDIENRPELGRKPYVYGLDGMRGIAALLVFFGHYLIIGAGAMFGVQLFFVISGFIITRTLLEEAHRHGDISLKNFYIRRLLRLIPALVVCTGVVVAGFTGLGATLDLAAIAAILFYYSNYYQAATASTLYSMPTWSLAIEEHYYLVFPTLFRLMFKRSTKRVLLVLSGICIAILLWRLFLFHSGPHMVEQIYMRTDTRIDAIVFGVMVAIASRAADSIWLRAVYLRGGMIAGVFMLAISYFVRNTEFRAVLMYTLQGFGLAFMMSCILYDKSFAAGLARRLLDGPLQRLSGKLSYSLYLYHLPILRMAQHHFGNGREVFAAAFCVSIAAACASYFLVERPILELRHRFGSHAG